MVAPGNKIIGAQSYGIYRWSGNASNNLVYQYGALNVSGTYNPDLLADEPGELKGMMYLSGTSMAAPVFSGTVALMFQVNPNLTPNLVKAILMYSAQPLKITTRSNKVPAS